MTPENKQKVIEAYRAGLEINPDADKIDKVATMMNDGKPTTLRQLTEGNFTTDIFFKVIENLVGNDQAALDRHLENVSTRSCFVKQPRRHKLRIPGLGR